MTRRFQGPFQFRWQLRLAEWWDAPYSRDAVSIQRDDLRERLDRIRAAAESDPNLSSALASFLARETERGWLHVTDEMVKRLRATGTHHER